VGDYVKLADTVEGHVEDIEWRSTRVRMLQNVVVTIPNKRVAESIITNYDMPEPRLALLIRVGVDYGADPDLVERLLVEKALHARLPGQLVHGPVRRPARAPKAHPRSPRGRGSPDPHPSLRAAPSWGRSERLKGPAVPFAADHRRGWTTRLVYSI